MPRIHQTENFLEKKKIKLFKEKNIWLEKKQREKKKSERAYSEREKAPKNYVSHDYKRI